MRYVVQCEWLCRTESFGVITVGVGDQWRQETRERRTEAHGRRDDIVGYAAWSKLDHPSWPRYRAERLDRIVPDERPSSGDEWGAAIATIAKSRRPVAERM